MKENIRLDKQKYVELKDLAYYAYDIYHKASDEKASILLKDFLAQYTSDEEKKIFTNTLLCPFDMELYQFLSNHVLSSENVQFICETFNITEEIINQKWQEYLKYNYIQCVGEGSLDYHIIFELSKEFLKNATDDEKKRKVS